MLTPYSPKTGLYWPPVVGPFGPPSVAVSVWLAVLVAASTGRRRGRPPWWRPSVWLVYWLAVLAAGVRPPCWRSVRGWCPSVAVVAVFVAAGGPFGPCVLAFHLVVFRRRLWPVAAGVRCWSLRALCAPSAVAVAVSLAVLAGVAGVGVIAPCRGPWSVSLASLAAVWLACWCHCAVPWWAVCRGPSAVLVSAVVSVAGRVRPSLLVCWCAVGGWRPFIAVFRGRGGPFGPSVVLVSVAGPCGPYGPYFGPCRLAGRVGLASGWRRWLAVLALAVVLALSKNVGPWLAGGGPCAVLSVVVASACLAGGPCWCRTSGGRGRPSNQRTKHQRPPWRPCWWCVLLACAGVGGAGVGGHVLAPVGPRAAAVGRRAVGVAY